MEPGEILDFTVLDPDIQDLIKAAVAVREYSYSPYSKFKVGAAILCVDGTVYRGCNVENASYPVGVCAERSTIVSAVSQGKRKFKALSVVADHEKHAFTTPCGMCRQTIAEFGDIPIYLTKSDMKNVFRIMLRDILPHGFGLGNAQLLK